MESTLQIQRTSFKALKTKCENVDFGDPIRLQKIGVELMNLLVGTSYHSLAINQCGLTYRIFCSRVNNTFTTYYNPELIDIQKGDKDEVYLVEGVETCQNFPTMNYTVKRPASIRVKYQDYMGNQRMTWLYNLPARFWLKGYDHTLGLTPYDRDNSTTTKLPEEHLYVKN